MRNLKSIDEAGQSPASSPAESDAVSSAKTSPSDLSRRRLVRGAMAVAPVVLTLRSGGVLAAASCIGVSQITSTNASGDFTGNGVSVVGDECIDSYSQNPGVCPGTRITGGTSSGVFVVDPGGVPGTLRCPGKANMNVAILSSAAVTSLVS